MSKSAWQNRITRYGSEAPDQLAANPRNWRTHPASQTDALAGVLREVGLVQNVIVNERTGYVVDGHARIALALRDGQASVPVTYVDLSEAEEALILATLDPLAAMAGTDIDQLNALINDAGIHTDLIDSILHRKESIKSIETTDIGIDEVKNLLDEQLDVDPADTLFASDNVWGIPNLLMRPRSDGVPTPVMRWGRISRKKIMPGTYHFYTDDYKFNALFEDPSNIIFSQCKAIVEPNVSTNKSTPKAWALFGIYKKRWIARWAQQYGIEIFVDLNIEQQFSDINLIGVPKKWRHYATRGYDRNIELLQYDYDIACAHAETNDIIFVVFGGGEKTRSMCVEHQWIHIPQEQRELN